MFTKYKVPFLFKLITKIYLLKSITLKINLYLLVSKVLI